MTLSGDGISLMLDRHALPSNEFNLSKFKELNKGLFDKNGGLFKNQVYKLPIIIINNRKIKISQATGISDKSIIEQILEYNIKVEDRKIKKEPKHILWIPLLFINNTELKTTSKEPVKETVAVKTGEPEITRQTKSEDIKKEMKPANQKKFSPKWTKDVLFGNKYQDIQIIDDKLQNKVFYLVSGHGGPDPGAVGKKAGKELCEDEYSYDVILRLARVLISHSADVYVIIQDSSDGIRDDVYLNNSTAEVLLNGDSLPVSQLARLTGQTDLINKISDGYPNEYEQYSINIHLDSRHNEKRIDIFFYYQESNSESKSLANSIYEMIKHKYDKNQPGRGYKGSVTTRNLFMLRKTNVPTVYIELGNIKNPLDQVRFVDKNNRQAIANWIADGIIKALVK